MLKLIFSALIFLSTIGCATKDIGGAQREPSQDVVLKNKGRATHAAPTAPTTSDKKEITPIAPNETELTQAREEAQKMKAAVAAAAEHIKTTHTTEQTPHHKREVGPVSPEKAFGWLKNGNIRFEKGRVRNDGATSDDRVRLVGGQKPHSIILSCSDSRVPPEVIFDQKLGEIFVVRTAGQAVDHTVIASIEYAFAHLGTNLLVIMGHESCGAVKATLSAMQGADLGSPSLNALAEDIKPHLLEFASKPPSPNLVDESWANVLKTEQDLLERSALIRDAVASGEVKIVKAMYHLNSGQVEWR